MLNAMLNWADCHCGCYKLPQAAVANRISLARLLSPPLISGNFAKAANNPICLKRRGNARFLSCRQCPNATVAIFEADVALQPRGRRGQWLNA
ncbi:hypothetical protein [Rhizobium sp. UBA1881]|uniref:hypothetical protein n=1 Tax=Rhizobium sp. UBA1881 TaxID=1947375 RepID=UPI0013AF9747|nr:hypothetical protein [Rhizobium sp. UBA1881]